MNEITEIFDVLKVLANGVTSLTILGGGIVILFKPLRKKAADWVAKQTNTAKQAEELEELNASMCACKETLYDVSDKLAAHIIQNDDDFRKHNDAQMLAIRLSIKEIYERNIDTKTLSKKERYDLFKLADAYDAFDGNSYIQADVAEMKTWPERDQTA